MMFLDIECTSLDSDVGMTVAIGLILPNGETKIFFAENPSEERKIIEESIELIKKFKKEPIVIWYAGFDIPFLVTRAIKHGLDISEIYDFKVIDLCKLVQKNLKFRSNKLDEVSKFFGIEKNLSITGKDVHKLYLKAIKGNEEAREKIVEHCKDDLLAMKKIFEKLESYIKKWLEKNTNYK